MGEEGRLIIVEGPDGSGKSVLVRHLYEKLSPRSVFTREPGSPHIDECIQIRSLLSKANPELTKSQYAALYNIDTSLNMAMVENMIGRGNYVVQDRCVLSDWAYRKTVEPYWQEKRQQLCKRLQRLQPILIFVIATPEVCVNRMNDRGVDQYEKDKVIDRITTLYNRYLDIATALSKVPEFDVIAINNDDSFTEEDFLAMGWSIVEETLSYGLFVRRG